MSEAPADPTSQPSKRGMFGFRPAYFLYAGALLASSVTAFGESRLLVDLLNHWAGIAPALLVLMAWACIFASRSRPRALCIVLCVVLLIVFCLITGVQSTAHPPSMYCRNNLKQIALGLHNFHDANGSFPPAYTVDENGQPMHSWRVLILPYLDHAALHRAYRFDEPWDGPNNRKLLSKMPTIYACQKVWNKHDNCTSYVAVVGPRTLWPGPTSRNLDDLQDGRENSILVIECSPGDIPWMEPRDLSFEEALRLLASQKPKTACGHKMADFFYEYDALRHVLLADGRVLPVPQGLDREVLASLLRIDDGGVWPDPGVGRRSFVEKRLRVGNCCRFAVFVLLALVPLPWVWLKPTRGTKAR